MSFKTRDGKTHQSSVLVGENGLPLDAIATISGSYVFLDGGAPLTYASGGAIVTLPVGYDLTPVITASPRYTGKYILQTSDGTIYYINRPSIDAATRTFKISVSDRTQVAPASINLSAGWIVAEADIVNRLATTSAAKIDSIEFRDMHFQMELDGDPVSILNTSDERINPATEEKQDSQITELQLINDELDTHTIQLQEVNNELDDIRSDLNSQFDESQSNQSTQISQLDNINTRIDAGNSTTTALASGGIFYGPWTKRTTPAILMAPNSDVDYTYYLQYADSELSTTPGVPAYDAGVASGIENSIRYKFNCKEDEPVPTVLTLSRDYYRVVVRNDSGSGMTRLSHQVSIGDLKRLVNTSTITSSISSSGQTLDITDDNYTTTLIQVSGTWVGSIVVEGSNNGVEWLLLPLTTYAPGLYLTNMDKNGAFIANTNGIKQVRLRAALWTSGTASLTVFGSDSPTFIKSDSLVRGHTDGAFIGNTGDRFHTDSEITGTDVFGFRNSAGVTESNELKVKIGDIPSISSGSLFMEGIRDDIAVSFSSPDGFSKIYDDGSVNGTLVHDPIEGQAVFSTGVAAGSSVVYRSLKRAVYEPGHQIVGEQSIELNQLPSGDASVFWGFSDGNNAVGYLIDSAGLSIIRKKNGVIVDKVYQPDWNRDSCEGLSPSGYKLASLPVALDVTNNNLYRYGFEWLGAAPVKYYLKSPNDNFVNTHVIEIPNTVKGSSLPNPVLPLSLEVYNDTGAGGDLQVRSGSWRGGIHTNKNTLSARNPNEDFVDLRAQGIINSNSSIDPLDAFEVYYGEWFEWSNDYAKLISLIKSDVAGTLYIDLSQQPSPINNTNDSVDYSKVLEFDPADSSFLRRVTPLQSRWVRHRYVNGSAAQTEFSLTGASTTTDTGSEHILANEIPDKDFLAGLNRSIQTIPNAAGDGFQEIPVDSLTGNPETTVRNVRDDILLKPLGTANAAQISVGTDPVRLDPSPVLNRRGTLISNDGSVSCSVGFSNTITFDSGSFRMRPGAVRTLPFNESIELWAVAQDTGGTQSALIRSGSSATGTVTDPSNALLSDDVRAVMDATGETLAVDGFTPGTSNPLVSVRLGMEARKQVNQFETAVIEEVQSGDTLGSGTVSSAPLAGGLNQLYVAYVTRNSTTNSVTQVLADGVFLSPLVTNLTSGNRRMDVWFGYGDFSAGVATASMTQATNAHIAVYRISNADPFNPIQDFGTTLGSGTLVSGPTLNGTTKGISLLGVSHTAASGTPGMGYTENVDLTNGTGSNTDSIATESKPLTVTANEAASYTLAATSAWSAVGVTVAPNPAQNPQVQLSYELSAVPGATSAIADVQFTADNNYIVDVTSDRAWTVTDIPNVSVIATGDNIGAAAAEIDYLYLELVDTTGSMTRISVVQGGEAVV